MKTIRKYHRALRRYVRRNPARSSGYFATFTLAINKVYNFKSLGIMIFFTALIVGIGESAQRSENKKTIKAIYANNDPEVPDETLLNEISDSPDHRGHK